MRHQLKAKSKNNYLKSVRVLKAISENMAKQLSV